MDISIFQFYILSVLFEEKFPKGFAYKVSHYAKGRKLKNRFNK